MRRLTQLLAAAGLALTGLDAHADFTTHITSDDVYWFSHSHVPDIDQRRAALPNDGTAYCVPTSSLNWLGYLTNHGAIVLGSGPTNWESQANYDLASAYLTNLGSPSYMDTHPDDGTDTQDGVDGLQAWLGNGWVVSHWYRNYTWSPGFENLRTPGMNGALILAGIGWYVPGGLPEPIRVGGHVVSITGIERNVSTRWVDVHDPGTDEGDVPNRLTQQSGLTTERYHFYPEFFNPNGFDPLMQSRLAYRFVGLTRQHNGNTAWGYFDYMSTIFPLFVATAVGPNEYTYLSVTYSGALPPLRTFPTPGGAAIVDAALSADLGSSFVIVGELGSTELREQFPGLSSWEPIEVGANAPTDVASGRHRQIYVLSDDGTRLICFDPDSYEVEADINLPAQCQDLVYDDAADELVLLSLTEHAILRYANGLAGAPDIQFPDDLPFGTEGSIAWDPTDGSVWCLVDGDPLLYRIPGGEGASAVQVVDLPGAVAPVAIDVSDNGRLFVSDQGFLMEYVEVGPGVYDYPPDPAFPGRQAGAVITAARSRTNYEPGLVDESWYDVLPTTTADGTLDCQADVDGSGDVDVDDLVALIVAWGTADPFADVNNDGEVDVDDLVALIVAWGACE